MTQPLTTRFDYVEYDEHSKEAQGHFKECFAAMSTMVDQALQSPRAKALVQTKLEEAYMWVGKAIRDDQIARNAETKLQEGRTNS